MMKTLKIADVLGDYRAIVDIQEGGQQREYFHQDKNTKAVQS